MSSAIIARTVLATAAAAALLLAACSDKDEGQATAPVQGTPSAATPTAGTASRTTPSPAPRTPRVTATAASPAPDDFQPARTVTKKDAPGAGAVIVDEVRIARNAGFDRIVFEFKGNALPGYEVRYVQAAAQCGSGAPVTSGGTAQLTIKLQPAAAHENGSSTIASTQIANAGGAAITDGRQICDFEADVTWVLGIQGDRPYRVVELSNPARLAIDVKQ